MAHPGGRPPKEMTPAELEKLVAMGCTDKEIAAWFGMTIRTLTEKKKEEPYKSIYDTAREITHISIRRQQLQAALKGNTAMLIWLGKTMLGQKDLMKLSGDADEPIAIQSIEVSYLKPTDVK